MEYAAWIGIRNFIEFSNILHAERRQCRKWKSHTQMQSIVSLCVWHFMSFHFDNGRHEFEHCWNRWPSTTLENIYSTYPYSICDAFHRFNEQFRLCDFVIQSVCVDCNIWNWKKHENETHWNKRHQWSKQQQSLWNWNWKTINSFCCKQTDKQFPRKKKEMQRNVWLEIVSSLTSEECKQNENHLNTIEEMGEYCMLLLLSLSLSPPRILHNLPNDTVTKTNVNYLRVIFLCVCNYKRKNNSLSQLIIVWMPDLNWNGNRSYCVCSHLWSHISSSSELCAI